MTEIARIVTEDLDSLAALYKHFWGDDSSLARMRETFSRIENNDNYIILGAKRDGKLVGSVMGVLCEELYGDCRPFMVVEDVIVDSECRRSGLGSELMRNLELVAVKRNCGTIILVTESGREDAIGFYGSLGYKVDGYRGFKKTIE